jgi:hypothetical protein
VSGTELSLPNDCPPTSSRPPAGTYYRLVGGHLRVGESVPAEDWTLPLRKRKGECAERADRYDVCECFAHSIFADANDLMEGRKTSSWARGKAIAQVELCHDMGRIEPTYADLGSSHHEWWPSPLDLIPQAVVMQDKT